MSTRTFLIPMQAPANGTGKGTRADPWRPKYLQELGLDFSIVNARDFCIADVTGDDERLDELGAMSDVVELRADGQAQDEREFAEARRMLAQAGIQHSRRPIDRDVIRGMREAVLERQRSARPTPSMRSAVMQRLAARGK